MSNINRTHLLALFRALQRSSTKFSSYNFKYYFLRRNRLAFRDFLGLHAVGKPSNDSKANDPQLLKEFYWNQRKELDVISRAAAVNRLFEGERLVVERPRLITSGGGAGMEASAGGAGQPVNPSQPRATEGEEPGSTISEDAYKHKPK